MSRLLSAVLCAMLLMLSPAAGAADSAAQTTVAQPPAAAGGADPFLWLEEKDGARAMAWVKEQDARSLAVLEGEPHYAQLYADALAIAQSKDRIPMPSLVGGRIYNFWQDDVHVRGLWRRTTPAGYPSATPAWTTVLDLDALAKREHANWVWHGADCEQTMERRCIVSLSDGGEDATTLREFDLDRRAFVPRGFSLSRGKQSSAWVNPDALLVAREWKPGEMTTSGYPYVLKRLGRGQSLTHAVEVYRGQKSDVAVSAFHFYDGAGHDAIFVERDPTFFTSEYSILTPSGLHKLNLPLKSTIVGMVAGRVLVKLNEDWKTGGTTFTQGSLVALEIAAVRADASNLRPSLVFVPGPRETLEDVGVTKNAAILTTYVEVRGRASVFTPTAGGWRKQSLDVPDLSSVHLIDATPKSDDFFFTVRSFLTPTTLYRANATNARSLSAVKALPAEFDATKDVAEQFEATSKDGTKIPYFIIRPTNTPLDGSNPTVINAYGGFQNSLTPFYSGIIGKLWLERGGVFVVANIRGGGEFGPAWHEAGRKTHRQLIFDDFYAVGKDLIARGVTSPRRLGIVGGSNGGLLMGVEFTQHPETWDAVVMQVPLLDMLRYEQIQAGTSWVDEYGTVNVPAEREFLASISPYNNLKAGTAYPEPFIWTTTKDDRVGPQHARKFAAKLASMQVPYLFYEVTEGGHGAGANLKEQAQTNALQWTYFTMKLLE
ncbi:MAG: S9 family peptidase [Candidatus Eremiobacteraeota bacterium]|nr:S9 family peptidase [Candidatus Eremiobacteraeota bacterium]